MSTAYDTWKLSSPYEQTPLEISRMNDDRDFELLLRRAARGLGQDMDGTCEGGRFRGVIHLDCLAGDVATLLALLAGELSRKWR